MITPAKVAGYREWAKSILRDTNETGDLYQHDGEKALSGVLVLCDEIDAMRADAELGRLVRGMPVGVALSHRREEGWSVTAFALDTPVYALHGDATVWIVPEVLFNGTTSTPEAALKAVTS